MKKIFGLAKKKKHPLGTPDNGSVLSAGYDLKEKDLGKVHKAALRGDLAKLKQLAKKNDINQLDKENRTALHLACASGHAEVVQFLVESKAKLNLCDNQNRSALMKGVQGQHEHCVSILLENHAEPNLVDVNGNTALHLAANIPSISTAVLLLQHGAEINAQNKEGFTPLTVAVREDHIEMAEFLLKETAEVNSVDQDQRTPLMLAAGNGQINMVKLLLHFDADITLKDTKGWSADDYAVMNGHHTCSLLIIEHGTQRTDGASVSHQGPNKKKKKLGGPSHDMEAGFSLGGPATDKEEHGANEAGGDFEENSQSESLSRISKSAADEWPSSEDEDESALTEKKLLKVNLIKTIGSKKGKASALPDTSLSGTESESENEIRHPAVPSLKALTSKPTPRHPVDPLPASFLSKAPQMTSTPLPNYRKVKSGRSAERETKKQSDQHSGKGSDSQEGSSPGEEEEAGVDEEEDEDEEEEVDEEEEDEEEEDDDDDEEEEDEEEDDDDEEEEEEEESEEEEENENEDGSVEEDDDCAVAAVQADKSGFEHMQKPSGTCGLNSNNKADTENTQDADICHDTGTSVKADHQNTDAKVEIENADLSCYAREANYGVPAGLSAAEDCVVSAIRVESKFSDEDESLEKECLMSSDQNIILRQVSLEDSMSPRNGTEPPSPSKAKAEESEEETEKDDDDSWNDTENSIDKTWNDSDRDEGNKTVGLSSSTLIALQRNVLAEVNTENADSHSDAEDDAEAFKSEKHRSSWGSSSEGSDVDVPKEADGNGEIVQQKSDVEVQGLQLKETSQDSKAASYADGDQLNTSWDSLSAVTSTKCASPKMDQPQPVSGLSSLSSPRLKSGPGVATVDDSEWDSTENDQNIISPVTKGEAVSPAPKENVIEEKHECSWEEEDKDIIEKASTDPSPLVSSAPEDEDTTRNQTLDDDDDAESVSQESEVERNSDTEKEDNSWDDGDESDDPENQMTMKGKLQPNQIYSLSQKSDEKLAEEDNLVIDDYGKEVAPCSFIDRNEFVEEDTDSEHEDLVDDRKHSLRKDKSEDSDSEHQKLQYDFTTATVKKLDVSDDASKTVGEYVCEDGKSAGDHEPRLIAYLPLENHSVNAAKSRQVSDDFNDEGTKRENSFSSPPTKDDASGEHSASDMNSEALPQTDIDDVDVDSPDEAENSGRRWHEVRDTEEPGIQTDDSTEDDDNNDEDGQVKEGDLSDENDQPEDGGESPEGISTVPEAEGITDKKRDFLSELGLEKGEDDQESWDSESHSENFNLSREEKQSVNIQSLELPTREEDPKETGSSGNDDNQGEDVDKDGTARKEEEKAKWRPLNVLSKLEGDLDQKKDLMEELGLGDVDDLDDASDWDSASSTSKRTLPGRRLASTELEEFPECPNSSGNEEGQDAAPAAPPTPQRNIGSDMKLPITSTTPAPQPHPRARKMLIQKLDSEEESDWEPDEITSSCKVSSADNQLQNKAEPPAVLKPGSPELNLMERDTKSSMDFDKQQQKDKDDMVDRAELDMNNSDHEDDDFRDQSSPEDRVGVGADVPWDKRYEKLWVEVEKREVKSTFKSVTGELKERFGELYKSTCPPENPTEEATSASTSAAEESSDDEEEEAIVRPTARARSTVLLTIPEQRESGLEESATESHDKSMCEESIKDSEQSASESSIHQSPNLLSNDILGSASPSLIAAQKEDTENRSHSTKASGDDQTTSVCAVETEQPADPVFKDTNTDLNKCDTNETDLENECENLGRFQVPAESRCSASSSAISEEDMDNFKLEVDEETAKASMEVEKPTSSWDSGGTTLEVNCEKPETGLTGAVHPVAAKSANRAPVQLHPPVQQPCNGEKHEKRAVEGTSKLELVRGAQHSRAPQTNTHANGDPLSVFDDSSLSDVSDDEGRLKTSGQQKTKNPEEMGMAEDFDELTQSSDTATDDTDSPTSGYRHASLLIQKLDSAILDSTTIAKLQNIFHEYERSIQKARSRHGYLADKVSQMEIERSELKISLEEARDDKSALERNQLELKTEVTNLKFQLKQEQENRRNATMMYNTNRDKLRRMEELHQQEVQEKQKLELTLRNLELEMRTLTSNMKQLEDDHSEAQRLLAQERSARTLQENLLNSHIRKQQEMEEENKRNKSKSNEALSQLTEASDRERELLQQTAALQEQLSVLKSNLEQSKANSSLKESHLLEENETFKEQLEDVRRDLKLSNEAVTQTVFSCNNQLTALKAELAVSTTRLENERHAREALEVEVESTRSRLAGALKEAELCQTGHADAEKALLREKEEHQRLKDRLAGETATSREAVSSLSQKLAKAESDANKMENEVNRVTLQLTEKSLLLDVLQREKNQASARVKDLETALQTEKDSVSRSKARQEATQERLAQVQSEAMLLRQQLEEAQNKGVAKERAVTDAQERFGDILSKLRSDCEERVHLVEERNKELASKAADFRDDIYKLEEEKNERETKLRQLQQELADSLKKLSMSEASLEVNTCYRNDLEKEKARLLKDLDRLKGKLEESEDQYVQAEKRINSLKGSLDEREKEVANATQKLQEALSAAATSAITIKQLEDAVQKLEIENARLEAAAKQQSSKIDALQKDVQETAMGRGHLEDLVANLQSSKMTLEDQLSREVQKQSILSHTAQDSRALWEEELKSRSKLGLRMAELEKEKGELTNQMEIEKRKAKKLTEQKKAVDTRLDQEMKRNTELQKEMYRLRTLLKTAKKKLRDQDGAGAEFGSPSNSLRMDFSRHSQADGAFGRMKDKVDDLQIQLDKEASRCSQLERLNGELKDQVVFLKGLSHSNEQLERSKRHLEEEVLDLRQRMEAAKVEQTQLEQYRHETEERVRQEIQQKLEQVNLFLQSQAASQEALDQIKAANEANLRSQLEQKIRDLEGELGRARTTQQDSLTQRDSTRTELERYQQLYKEELRLRKSLASKLERANSRLSEANSKLLNERSRSLLTSNITNGSLVGPSLDLGSLGSPANYGATLGPLNRSLSLGFPLLNPVTERQNRGVEDYLAKMQSELDRNISKELRNATAELDDASARMSPVGSASRVELDPLNRVKQQYLEVLKKNNRI